MSKANRLAPLTATERMLRTLFALSLISALSAYTLVECSGEKHPATTPHFSCQDFINRADHAGDWVQSSRFPPVFYKREGNSALVTMCFEQTFPLGDVDAYLPEGLEIDRGIEGTKRFHGNCVVGNFAIECQARIPIVGWGVNGNDSNAPLCVEPKTYKFVPCSRLMKGRGK